MLHLQMPTDPRWANIAEMNLADILADHAFCEQKAASSCITLIVKYPDRQELVDGLSPIVSEEWGHFRRVMKEMRKRGYTLTNPRKDEYVNNLLSFLIKGQSVNKYLADQLLSNALIEARSCERFRILSLELSDPELRQFYHEFMVSEAGHYTLFKKLALHYAEPEWVERRWKEWLAFEAEMLPTLALRGDRMH